MQARVYALTKEDAKNSTFVSFGTLTVADMHANLFDTGATLSFISSRFVEMISAKYPIGDTYAIAVSTPSGSEVHTDRCVPG